MKLQPFTIEDLQILGEFEPPGWGDLVPRFSYALGKSNHYAYKIAVTNTPIAIGTIIFHRDSAWLASIIVHPDHRNHGYGRKITQSMIDTIDRNIYTTIWLDATDLGFPVYKALGFHYECDYAHFKSNEHVTGLDVSTSIIPYRDSMLEQILEMDRKASAEDRRENLVEHLPLALVYHHNERVEGFFLPSFGNGLIIAEDPIAGVELMKYRLENNYFAIFPAANEAAGMFLQCTPLEQFRISRRMYMGEKRNWMPSHMYNRISGQLG